MVGSGGVQICAIVLGEFGIAHPHRFFKVFVMDQFRDLLGRNDGVHQGRALDLILADGDDRRRRIGFHLENCADRFNALKGRQPSVVGARSPTSLSVAEHRHPCIQAEPVGHDILDSVG